MSTTGFFSRVATFLFCPLVSADVNLAILQVEAAMCGAVLVAATIADTLLRSREGAEKVIAVRVAASRVRQELATLPGLTVLFAAGMLVSLSAAVMGIALLDAASVVILVVCVFRFARIVRKAIAGLKDAAD